MAPPTRSNIFAPSKSAKSKTAPRVQNRVQNRVQKLCASPLFLPKFVSRHASYAFRENSRGPGSGMLLHHGSLEEPSAFIRECAMGFAPNSTAAPGASESLRRRALGAAIDMNIATWVIRTALQQAPDAKDA